MYRFEWRRDTSHVSRYKFNENLVILKKKDIKSLSYQVRMELNLHILLFPFLQEE